MSYINNIQLIKFGQMKKNDYLWNINKKHNYSSKKDKSNEAERKTSYQSYSMGM